MRNYRITKTRNFMCVPVLLEAICLAEGYSLTQVEIADFFGVTVPHELFNDFKDISNLVANDDPIQWGVKIADNAINEMFAHYGIDLREQYIPINTIAEEIFDIRLKQELATHSHIICGFRYNSLFEGNPGDYGHVSIICDVNNDRVTLFDPGPKDAGYKTVNIDDLYFAIRSRQDGLWCIDSIK